MTTTAQTPLLTVEDLLAMPDPEDGNRYELLRGRLVCMAAASPRSNVIAFRTMWRVQEFVNANDLGVCGGSEAGFRLTDRPDTFREPDGWFIRKERIPAGGVPDTFWTIAPDLVVEVLSPTDRSGPIAQRVGDYLAAGTPLVWVIDPSKRSAAIFRGDTFLPTLVTADGILDGEDVLPGFSLKLADVLI
ncbi:MAG: Uma2 family endonuclease [Chloroflexi bacterium]|nr:Uma2 family endonuclease [Chloroflexota bacterium]